MARRNPALSFLAWLPQAALLGVARLLPYRARLAFAAGFTKALVALVPDMRARVEGNREAAGQGDQGALASRLIASVISDQRLGGG